MGDSRDLYIFLDILFDFARGFKLLILYSGVSFNDLIRSRTSFGIGYMYSRASTTRKPHDKGEEDANQCIMHKFDALHTCVNL